MVGHSEYYNGQIPFIRSAEIDSTTTEILITKEGFDSSSAKMVKVGDILFALYGATSGEVGRAKIIGAINQAILAITPKNGYDAEFIMQWLRKNKKNITSTYLQGGQGNLSGAIVQNLNIFESCYNEQKKIGILIQNLDTLIALHQCKHDKLCMFKKAMLEKMFTKVCADEPEIRFKDFAGKWNKNPLNYYLDPSTEKNYAGKYNKENVLSVSGEAGIVNQIEFQGRSFAGASVANYGIVHKEDVVYTKSPLKLNPYGIIKANKGRDGIVSTLYAVYKVKIMTCANFVDYYFCSDHRLNCYLKPLVNKGAKNDMKVTNENALLGKVTFPQIIEEQIKIATFFEKVDSLISLHQRELDKLKNIKQACLEKMFV